MNNKRILIVDDHGELRKLVRMTLEFSDYELHEAENGQRALEIVDAVHPDVVILDVMMPGEVDGYEACRRIKSNDKTQEIHVILLTARGQKKDIEEGMETGANGYLVKPFSPLELIRQVEAATH